VIQYRSFRNDDPPAVVEIWNEALGCRGAVQLRSPTLLEYFVFSKPYFDPAGFILAVEDGARVGFAHAGFGPAEMEKGLSTSTGVVAMVAVRPSHQRRAVGGELLRRAEEYLRQRGAQTIYAGGVRPLNPFYFGLYGGSESPGFLASNKAAAPFLKKHGYRLHDTCQVFHRKLEGPLQIVDGRFPALRCRYEVFLAPQSGAGTWWQECVLGPLELLDFRLKERGTSQLTARASVWEMEAFSHRWNEATVGLVDVEVLPNLRRQGLAKFLLAQMLLHLQDQFFTLVEVQTMQRNDAAMHLYQSLGFQQVDSGHVYQKE
jgi:ribosomal protein S18 acetylase RimI-like enzyme